MWINGLGQKHIKEHLWIRRWGFWRVGSEAYRFRKIERWVQRRWWVRSATNHKKWETNDDELRDEDEL